MTLSETILPGTVPEVVRNDTALYKHHGFWVPRRPVWYKRVIPGISNISRGAKHVIMRSPSPGDFFERLPLGLLIQFLDHLTETGDLDALRSLLMTYDWMRPLVIVIEDILSSDVDLFHVKGLRHMALAEFLELPPSDPTRRLPVRIFTVTGSSMRSFCSKEVYSVLSKRTPLIVRLFGPNTRLADDLRQFMEGGVIPSHLNKTLPLVLCQDSDKRNHPHICFSDKTRVDTREFGYLWRLMGTGYKPFPHKRSPNGKQSVLGFRRSRIEDGVEYYNLQDGHGFLQCYRDSSIKKLQKSNLTLVFSSECKRGIRSEVCIPPPFVLPQVYGSSRKPIMEKLSVVFHGPRIPYIDLNPLNKKLPRSRNPSHVELVNANWSESNPSAGFMCQHAIDDSLVHKVDAYTYSVDRVLLEWRMPDDQRATPYIPVATIGSIKKFELIGIPDTALHVLHLENTSELVWKRMTAAHSENEKRYTFQLPSLSSLELYSRVGSKESMPLLACSAELEKLELVALPGSTHPWNLCDLIKTSDLRYGLKNISVTGDKPLEPVTVGDVCEKAESLSFVDCIPDFLPDSGSMKPFHKLKKLSLDAEFIISLRSTQGSVSARWSLFLSNKSFPCLEVLGLHSSEDRASFKASVVEIDVPSTCVLVGLSPWIQYGALELRQSGRASPNDPLSEHNVASSFNSNAYEERWAGIGKREQLHWYKTRKVVG